MTPEEQEAVDNFANPTWLWCYVGNGAGRVCTRAKGHAGGHVAGDPKATVFTSWPRATAQAGQTAQAAAQAPSGGAPTPADEQDAIDGASKLGVPTCGCTATSGYFCTRTPAHTGDHIAADRFGVLYGRWPNAQIPLPLGAPLYGPFSPPLTPAGRIATAQALMSAPLISTADQYLEMLGSFDAPYTPSKCECGAHKTSRAVRGSPAHSAWCPWSEGE